MRDTGYNKRGVDGYDIVTWDFAYGGTVSA